MKTRDMTSRGTPKSKAKRKVPEHQLTEEQKWAQERELKRTGKGPEEQDRS